MEGGSSRNKIAASVMAVFFALAVMLSGNVAEAGADINYEINGVRIEPGRLIIEGYFYNSGDAGARIKKMHFTGSVAGRKINVVFSGSNLNVKYLGADEVRYWTFTITDSYFTGYDDNPARSLRSYVTFGN